MCMNVCSCEFMCIKCVPGGIRSQKRESDLLKLELLVVVNLGVGARNQPVSPVRTSTLNHRALSLSSLVNNI